MSALERRLEAAAPAPTLLVACDYDGTVAPIVADPSKAWPNREAKVALRELNGLPRTHVAVISGRALRDLAALTDLGGGVVLVGSHGGEFDLNFAFSLPKEAVEVREAVVKELTRIVEQEGGTASGGGGFLIEKKPAGVTLHYRGAERLAAARALKSVLAGPGNLKGVVVRHGKEVVELAVVPAHKGQAIQALRNRVGATVTVFIGDDVTDEDGFAVLRQGDVGIKVGEGETLATYRVAGVESVAAVLMRLYELRSAWVAGLMDSGDDAD
jgi:trehalose 6-phosphate phosphatase